MLPTLSGNKKICDEYSESRRGKVRAVMFSEGIALSPVCRTQSLSYAVYPKTIVLMLLEKQPLKDNNFYASIIINALIPVIPK